VYGNKPHNIEQLETNILHAVLDVDHDTFRPEGHNTVCIRR